MQNRATVKSRDFVAQLRYRTVCWATWYSMSAKRYCFFEAPSSSPPPDDFADLRIMAAFMGIDLGVNDDALGVEILTFPQGYSRSAPKNVGQAYTYVSTLHIYISSFQRYLPRILRLLCWTDGSERHRPRSAGLEMEATTSSRRRPSSQRTRTHASLPPQRSTTLHNSALHNVSMRQHLEQGFKIDCGCGKSMLYSQDMMAASRSPRAYGCGLGES